MQPIRQLICLRTHHFNDHQIRVGGQRDREEITDDRVFYATTFSSCTALWMQSGWLVRSLVPLYHYTFLHQKIIIGIINRQQQRRAALLDPMEEEEAKNAMCVHFWTAAGCLPQFQFRVDRGKVFFGSLVPACLTVERSVGQAVRQAAGKPPPIRF